MTRNNEQRLEMPRQPNISDEITARRGSTREKPPDRPRSLKSAKRLGVREPSPEEAVFTLVHLFGHTVQWNLDEKLRLLGLANSGVKQEDLSRIYQYERQASQLGLALLQETAHKCNASQVGNGLVQVSQ